ncbi:beta-ketoacyl synthase N-terminal-like domain-containing protein [Lysobacter enzymogenes]|uniref:beta-ketoacyl synthase N-terminal-like domain-containing protein n=1 Tax=Lysobacter enzymogenes TaxID=69 RepID=UPI001A956708|nr:beta-ketoacyl synthase N-terminal-like domain-containing protein [Lysobacter enzymogenes]QQP96954.1 hypothetical protein JHW38_02545 [Lysobacter enzymogenes]
MSNANPATVLERLTAVIAATLKLPAQRIETDAPFESLGIDSIIMMELIAAIEREFGAALTPAQFTTVSTLDELAGLLQAVLPRSAETVAEPAPAAAMPQAASDLLDYVSREYAIDLSGRDFASADALADALVAEHGERLLRHYGLAAPAPAPAASGDIAIVGLSCALPDAPDARAFWRNLLDGRNSVREIPDTRWRWQDHHAPARAPGKTVSRWGALIDGVDCFDAGFFGIGADEAQAMDPQQRLLLQQTYHALEDAGLDVAALAGSRTGVFVGYQYSEYEQRLRALGHRSLSDGPVFSSSSPTYYLSNRISFAFDLRGPSESINVNCASSAVAINRAYYSLVNGESALAIAAGVSLNLFAGDYIASSQYGLLSADGSSGVFDEDAAGFTRGEGVAAVVLKRLEDAERDGDRIYAVIKSCHQNYRGAARSLSEIRHEPIADALTQCYGKAAVAADTVRYIEVDGFATKWADSFEFEAIKNALGDGSAGKRCALGSVKGNIGNVEAASGVTNLIKLALSLHHGRFPATISKRRINSFIDIEHAGHPLYIADRAIGFDELREGDAPIRAGINSCADSGTNVHILLEEYRGSRAPKPDAAGERLFVLSARDEARLLAYVRAYLEFLDGEAPADSFERLIYTAQTARAALDARLAIVAADREDLARKLRLVAEAGIAGWNRLDGQGIHVGHAAAARSNPLAGAIGADMAQLQLEQAQRSGQWRQAALLWVNGVSLPWRRLWPARAPQPAALPGYPFARERHWLDFAEDAPRAGAEPVAAQAEPAAAAPEPAMAWRFVPASEAGARSADAMAMAPQRKAELLLAQEVARQLRRPQEQIDRDATLIALGMESVGVARLILLLDRSLGCRLSPHAVFEHPSIGELAAYLARDHAEALEELLALPAAEDDSAQLDPFAAAPASERAGDAVAAAKPRVVASAGTVVPMQTRGDKPALFAVPGAGGSALSLQQLSHALGPSQPFYCLEPAGLDGRSAPHERVEAMAQEHLAAMASIQRKGPYRLIGYSNGGVVAFEMARQLLERGEAVASLVLIDSLCPNLREDDMAEMTAAVFRNFAKSLGASAELDARQLRQIPEGERSAHLYDYLAQLGAAVPRAQFIATFDVATASERACRAYRPRPLPQPVDALLLRAGAGFAGMPDDYGWAPLLSGGLRVSPITADHFSILERGPAAAIARKLQSRPGKAPRKSAAADLEAASL